MSRKSKAIISAVCVFFLLINLNLFISQNELASQRLNGFSDDGRAGNQTVPEIPFVGIRSISPSHASTAGGDLINIATENISFTDKREIVLFHDNNTTLENVVVNLSISDISDDGLRAHWNMDDEMNGTVQDFSGNNHHATLSSGTTISADNGSISSPEGSLLLDSREDFLEIPGQTLGSLSSGTISAWVNLSSNDSGVILAKQHDGINSLAIFSIGYTVNVYGLVEGGQQGHIYFHSENQHQNLASNNSIDTGTWHHLAVTFSPNGGTIWIDGVSSGSTTSAQNIPGLSGGTTRIGYWNNGLPLSGMIDDFSIWNRELNASEIEFIAQSNPLRNTQNLHFQQNGEEIVHHYSENGDLKVLLPKLVPGNNTIVAAFIVGENIEDLSDGPFAEVSVT
ncbi:MAG: LamG domain-containing protein, partial [Candidatus Poseidoniaceae archaeon]|nr:LamG domain-containing protein [Candidatus Poseidoniaceae archaeon]